jgi:ribonuclease HI
MIHIQYKRDPNHPRANFLHLQLSKEEAVEATTSLVSAPQNSNSWIGYTDGLYNPENGGASAAVCPELTMAISAALGVNPYYSNHECEAIGLFLALQLLKQAMGQERRSRAFILTDNMGVICRLENYNQAKPGQYIFQEIAALWKDIQADINLTFVWCPGHRGIQGNEASDRLAKDTTERNGSPDRIMKANLTKISASLNSQLQSVGRKTLQKRISNQPVACSALINQLIAGHSPLHHHLYREKRRRDPTCPFCPGKETTRHLLDFCPQYRNARRNLLIQTKKKRIRCDWNQPHQLLKNPKDHYLIDKFLKATGRFAYL